MNKKTSIDKNNLFESSTVDDGLNSLETYSFANDIENTQESDSVATVTRNSVDDCSTVDSQTSTEVGALAKNEMDMTKGNLAKKILLFSLPVILSGELQLLYNAADLVTVGIFVSEDSVGAISATNSLINLIVQLFLGLSVGSNVLMARCVGSKQREKGQRVVYTSMILSVVLGLVIGIFGAFFSRYFLQWMGTPSELISLSTTYLTIYFIGVPFSMIYNFGAALLRAVGDTKRPFYFLASAGLFNVGFNLFFVLVCGLGVAGVALGTIVSQAISAVCVVVCLLRYKGFFHFKWSEMKFFKDEAVEIAKIGLPAGVQGMVFSISNVLIQSSVNSLGKVAVNGNGASCSIEGFVYTTMNSVAQACIAFVSANFGAKNFKNIKKSVILCLAYVCLFGIGVGVPVTIFGRQLLSIYLPNNGQAIEVGYSRLWVICLTYFTCGIMDVFAYALRGIGYSTLPAIVSLCGACGLRILWILIVFPTEAFNSLQGLAISYPVSWVVTLLIGMTLFAVLFERQKQKFQPTLDTSQPA